MPRGKNYVNNNKGMRLQAYKNKGGARENVDCIYGVGCARKDCIYRHPPRCTPEPSAASAKSQEPCMAFLAGFCTFTSGCSKRHPSRQECDRLRQKYKSIACRFGDSCKTNGCLYKHPSDAADEPQEPVNYIMPDPQTLHQAQRTTQTQQEQQHVEYQRQMHLQILQQQQIYQQQAMFYQAQQHAMYHEQYAQQFPPMGGAHPSEPPRPPTADADFPPPFSEAPPSRTPPSQHQPDTQSHQQAVASEELSADAREWSPASMAKHSENPWT